MRSKTRPAVLLAKPPYESKIQPIFPEGLKLGHGSHFSQNELHSRICGAEITNGIGKEGVQCRHHESGRNVPFLPLGHSQNPLGSLIRSEENFSRIFQECLARFRQRHLSAVPVE